MRVKLKIPLDDGRTVAMETSSLQEYDPGECACLVTERAPKLFHGPGWLSCIADPLPAVAVVAAAAAGVRPALSARLVRSADAGQGAEEAALLAAAEAMAAAAASGPNADKGRKIRDVRDLFAGSESSGGQVNYNKHLGGTAGGGRLKSSASPGVHSQDSTRNHVTQDTRPKVLAGQSGNVIFGDKNALLKDIKHKNASTGKNKRDAPKSPVLVDVDVGFHEQNVGQEVPRAERGSPERRSQGVAAASASAAATMPVRPPRPSKMAAANKSAAPVRKSRPPGALASSSEPGRSHSKDRGSGHYQGSGSRDKLDRRSSSKDRGNTRSRDSGSKDKPKDKANSHPPNKKEKVNGHSASSSKDKASSSTPAHMTSSHSKPKSSAPDENFHIQVTVVGPKDNGAPGSMNPYNNNEGEMRRTSENTVYVQSSKPSTSKASVLDNSSSSGIGSSISESSETEQFKTKLLISSSPHGGGAVISPAPHYRNVVYYESSADDLDDSDSDFCDEMTMDFDEEEEQVEKRRLKLYEEYQGEDFSKYLKDDEDFPKRVRKQKKKVKKRDRKTTNESQLKKTVAPTISPSSSQKPSSAAENPGKRSLKLKLGQMLALPGLQDKLRGGGGGSQPGVSGIHAFSYADSKIGTLSSERDIDENLLANSHRRRKSSGSGSALFHDAGDATDFEQVGSHSHRWWTKDTLSAKTLDSNSDIMLKVKRHDALQHMDFDLNSSLSADSINPLIHRNGYKTDDEDDRRRRDFESYRKSNFLYNSKGRKKGSKPNTSLFRKISRSFKKSQLKDAPDNMVENPLSLSDTDDVYL